MVDIEVYKALSDENRLRILNILMQRELCVCEIEAVLSVSQSNVSRHLNKLKQAGILVSKKESQWAYYTISPKFIATHAGLYEHLAARFKADDIMQIDCERLNSLDENCTN